MRVICQTVPGSPWMLYLRAKLPGLIEVVDPHKDAYGNYIRSLEIQGDEPAIHIEDDIILTTHFLAKAEAVIAEHPRDIIQFFSMRKDDATKGSRWDRQFSMNQCTYLPRYTALDIAAYAEPWRTRYPEHRRGGYDLMLRDWLKGRNEAYWLHVPSLVQHREAKSRISPRSSRRQSPTFQEPDL
jgi:hypothetical protein